MKVAIRVIIAAVFIHILIFSVLSIVMYRNIAAGISNGGDFANVNQVLWSTIHGRFLKGTTLSYMYNISGPYSHFAVHFEPIYLLVLPFYALLPTVETLIFIKSLFLALAAIPLFLIAKDKLGGVSALFISFAYLLSPVVALQMFYPLHAEEYAAFFVASMFYFFQRSRFKIFIIFALLTILIKESMPIYLFIFAVYALIKRRRLKWVVPLIAGSLVYFITVVYFIIPFFADYVKSGSAYTYSTSIFSLGGIYQIIKQTVSPEYIGSLIKFLIPFGLVFPLLSPVVIFMIPDIFIKLGIVGIKYGVQHSSVMLTIFIFISLVYFLKNFSSFFSKRIEQQRAQRLVVYISIILLFSMAYRSKGFLNPRYYRSRPYYEAQREAINFIPPDASVSAPNYMLPHLSNRFQLDEIGRGKYSDLYRGYDYLIIDTHWEYSGGSELKRMKELIKIMPQRQDYKLVFNRDGILIYKKS